MSFANSELMRALAGWFRPLVGRDPYNKRNVDDAIKLTQKIVGVLEEHLLHNTYLVGERVTLADFFTVGIINRGFEFVFGKEWRQEHPNTTRWYETVYNQPSFSAVVPKLNFIEEGLKNQAPNQDKKDKAPKEKKEKVKEAPKPKAKEVEEEEEEEDKPAPKSKHPLETLEKPTLILDDWKRKYSNEETREVALPWFWEHYKPEEYSLWKVDYKYNDELTQVFMTSNLIGIIPSSPFCPIIKPSNTPQVDSSPGSKPPGNISSAVHLSMA